MTDAARDATPRPDNPNGLDRRIEASIQRAYGGLARASAPGLPEEFTAARPHLGRRLIGLAAAVLLVTASLIGVKLLEPSETIDAGRLYTAYDRLFAPHVVCTDAESFERYAVSALGASITADYGAGVTFVGWRALTANYDPDADAQGPRTLVARAPDGTMLLGVFGTGASVEFNPNLNVFSTRISGVAVHEVSPLDEPRLLPLLSAP